MSLPPELTISIELVKDDEYLTKVLRPNGQEICRNTFHFNPGMLLDMEPQWMLEKAVPRNASEWSKRGPTDNLRNTEQAEKLAAYGLRMYTFLFGDAVKWNGFLEFNDAYRQQVRVTLALHANAAALWQLPWEYLHDGEDFLALNGRFWLTRSPFGLAQLAPPPAALPIRVLVVVSAPDDQAGLDTEEEIGVIQQALAEAVSAGRIRVEYLDDATLPNLGATLRSFNPHVLHYTGHGAYDAKGKRSFLALESDEGKTVAAGIEELRPHLNDAPGLRLVVLSGCQTARTSELDAFSGVATGLLEKDIPAVLAMQFSILDQSGIELARAFYQSLAQGEPPEQAMQRARVALAQFEDGPGFDWGIPALYLRATGLHLVSTDAPIPVAEGIAALVDMGGLPLPPHFVGRKNELRLLRRALRDPHITTAFVRGIGGMGKSSLAAKLIERPGCELAAVLVLRCHQLSPYDLPAKLAHFLSAQGKANHAEAAKLLLDSTQPPDERARRALEMIHDQRYLIVFDNFESVSHPASDSANDGWKVLMAFFAGLIAARWRGLLLFTSRFPWEALDEHIGRGTALARELPDLNGRQAIMLMDNLPRLRREPIERKVAVYRKVGGHPKSLELLEGWLSSGRLIDLLDDAALDGLLRPQWEEYFLKTLLAQLPPAEYEMLVRLSIFDSALDEEEFDYTGVTPQALQHWNALSLLQRQQNEPTDIPSYLIDLLPTLPEAERRKLQPPPLYAIHPLVRDYLLGSLPAAERTPLHAWAAAFYGRPFVKIARQMVRPGANVTDEEIESFARTDDGVVKQLVARTDDMPAVRNVLSRALQWQAQLFQAGQYEAAGEVVRAVYDILARWGERDRAKALLQGSIQTLEGFNKAVAQGNLANLLQDEGKRVEALTIHEQLYQIFAALDARPQMGASLAQQSTVLREMGRLDEAITKQEASLEINRTSGDEQGLAVNLYQLSVLHRIQKDYPRALECSQAAEALDRKRKDETGIALDLHEQGVIFNRMADAAEDESATNKHRQSAVGRFNQSLEIKRRLGDQSGIADSLAELGKMLMNAGHMAQAIANFNEAREIYTREGNPAKLGIMLELLGLVHERQGQFPAALEKYQQALRLLQQYGSPQDIAIVEQQIGRVQAKMQSGR